MKSQRPSVSVRETVLIRDRHYCTRCGRSITNYPASIHHRRARGMGGTRDLRSSDPRNLVLLCGSATTAGACHSWIESFRSRAYEQGWLVRRYEDLDSPMVTLTGVRVFLFADGTRQDVAPTYDPTP